MNWRTARVPHPERDPAHAPLLYTRARLIAKLSRTNPNSVKVDITISKTALFPVEQKEILQAYEEFNFFYGYYYDSRLERRFDHVTSETNEQQVLSIIHNEHARKPQNHTEQRKDTSGNK
jgi:hypothetical protein